MRIRHFNLEEESPINMMPMIDMVFLLLIFFLLATTFAQAERERPVQLPGTDSDEPISAERPYLIINITAEGKVVIAGLTYNMEKPDDLKTMLEDVAKNPRGRKVLIRADERGVIKSYAEVVELCYQAGLTEHQFAYLPRSVKLGLE